MTDRLTNQKPPLNQREAELCNFLAHAMNEKGRLRDAMMQARNDIFYWMTRSAGGGSIELLGKIKEDLTAALAVNQHASKRV